METYASWLTHFEKGLLARFQYASSGMQVSVAQIIPTRPQARQKPIAKYMAMRICLYVKTRLYCQRIDSFVAVRLMW
jgi:hypothetical protein